MWSREEIVQSVRRWDASLLEARLLRLRALPDTKGGNSFHAAAAFGYQRQIVPSACS